ncbi:rho guanine nucleotide exchange factor 18a [Mastacembelus armatus]|uniref:Rho/rac guanine nucleotide exchange factor (GEF) 18a n=1 Tax=Mastacembelus armatus TaxID=205130 RepID=A0A3Q3L0F3_9TELE|nr:rho guanine nucleotide exchange factor 18-like [Mastacembelus armatus]XP_026170348.1 rho guanine nucleotide exchange factor 18-like [Mastacembelus armatus]XP_026170349.1 rho guanine nucleotide exchange factor 18-like [Mastacembelus armatus]XP_026170350.1 rho guanine nucleotide exchange factor 18-like [Mastacembelus armatus]
MTVTPKKHSGQPDSSSYNTSPRSRPAQMEDVDGLRLKHFSEDSVSLAEPINLEDSHYARLRGEIECDAQNLEAESWSVAVDQNYMKTPTKEAVKRQDVIYELMQTEMHHVRTLKILLHVYMHELRKSQLIEEDQLQRLFPRVGTLLNLHQHFLDCLKVRQKQSQEEGCPNNYQITKLGDILISQFSGTLGQAMMDCYSLFCSHHNEAIRFYKEQLQNNKKLQILIKKIGQLQLVRRLGIPECFLLVTQRITKYPVLLERIIQNTEAETDEYQSLVQGLTFVKDTISLVNAQVREYEKATRLREIGLRLEPKSQGRLKDSQLFRREDLIQGDRVLRHEGTVTWKASGRHKDIHAVLLSDVLLLLQEKDQKLVFASMDNKPPVISLQRLIVREVAHEEKAMFLISACTTGLPKMYEIHTGSTEERNIWTNLIRAAVECYPDHELYFKLTAELQQFQDDLKEKDDQIKCSLAGKQQIYATLYKTLMEQEYDHKGLLVTDHQQGEALLKGALEEVENLQNLLFLRIRDPNLMDKAKTFAAAASDSGANILKNGDVAERRRSSDTLPVYISHTITNPQLEEEHCSEGLEQSADDDTLPMPKSDPTCSHVPEKEVCDRVMMLAKLLYSLQAVIVQQDSQIELQRAFQAKTQQSSRHYTNALLEQEKQRNLEKQKEELNNLQKLKAQQQEEQQRWEKEQEWQRRQIETLEAQLQQREEDCRKWEEKIIKEKAELERQKEEHQQSLERLRVSIKIVEKEKEHVSQEKERLVQSQEKINKLLSKMNLGHPNYDDPTQYSPLYSSQSFRRLIVNGGGTQTFSPHTLPSNTTSYPMEIPPKVPPRKESIIHQPARPELPVHLISTTNQVQKPAVVQQRIPTKLAALSKGKEKSSKTKKSHQRTQSAASLDVSQVLPIRVTGKEGGSLKAKRNASPQRIYQSDTNIFMPPKSASGEAPPPLPPPFPKDVLEKHKEKVIFL